MKTHNKIRTLLLTGLFALSLTFSSFSAPGNPACHPQHDGHCPILTEGEVATLLAHYQAFDEETITSKNITITFYDENFELVFSATVCPKDYECDARINQLINQSDFITEIDDTVIFILNQ